MCEEDYEEFTYFASGDCSCEHEPEEHGWGSCDQDGCKCEAGWEE